MATTTSPFPDLAGESAKQNIAAGGDINSLTQLLSGINQSAYLSAPGRQQQLGTIENQLAGNLDPSTIYDAQLHNAEKYGAGGFSSDSEAWQTAIQRGLGIDRENLIGAGQTAMNQFYSKMPEVNAQDQAVTPALLEQHQATASAQALEQQRITNQSSQFEQTLQNTKEQFASQLGLSYDQLDQNQKQFVDSQAQQSTEFNQNLQNTKEQFASQLGLSYAQLDQQQKQFVDSQAQQATQYAGNLGLGYYQASIRGGGGGGGGRGGSGSGGSTTPDPFPYTRTTTSTTGGDSNDQAAFDEWLNSFGFGDGGLSGGVYNPPTDAYGGGGAYNDFGGELYL